MNTAAYAIASELTGLHRLDASILRDAARCDALHPGSKANNARAARLLAAGLLTKYVAPEGRVGGGYAITADGLLAIDRFDRALAEAKRETARRTEPTAEPTTTAAAAAASPFALSYPCTDHGDWAVLQGHADYCAAHGHAEYVVDGVTREYCPRCGVRVAAVLAEPVVVAAALVVAAERDGGATLTPDGAPVRDGVMVGRPGLGMVLASLADVRLPAVVDWARGAVARMTDADCFGVWVDEMTGAVHFDVSERFTNLPAALYEAHDRGELAVYDIASGCEYRVADQVRGLHY